MQDVEREHAKDRERTFKIQVENMQDVEREHSRALERAFKSLRKNVQELERKKQELEREYARD